MAVADYFSLHCCRPAAFTQQVCSGVGDTGTGSLYPCRYEANAREPVHVPDTGTGTRAGYHATDVHGFPCTSLSQNYFGPPAALLLQVVLQQQCDSAT